MRGIAMRHLRGFTLIELMVVVGIIALLAAIAIPTYQRYAYRSRRPDGQELLIRLAQAEERYYTGYNRYPVTAATLYTDPKAFVSDHGYYTAALAQGASAGSTYIITATPVPGGAQDGDACGALTIDNTGAKGQTGQNTNGPCWGN
jgi:type IV pilus assembly protein PilE